MNKEWSEQNKEMQQLLKRETFSEGITALMKLRQSLTDEVLSWKNTLSEEDFSAIPFINAQGYHSKTIAYSLWHIFRIEDIVVNTLIRNEEQILFQNDNLKQTNSSIITTGNELEKQEIAYFSKGLDIDGLYGYILDVKSSTERWLDTLEYSELKRKFDDTHKERLISTNTVSTDPSANWLIDYWCGKDIKGLIKMPLSRHWIMHIEAAIRIMNKLK